MLVVRSCILQDEASSRNPFRQSKLIFLRVKRHRRSMSTAAKVNSDIKNMELAELGKKRIEWANQSMKVLQIIRKEFIKNQPLKGIRISACLHITAETANLGICLRDGRAQVGPCPTLPAHHGWARESGHLPARRRSRSRSLRLKSAVDAGRRGRQPGPRSQ